MYTLSAVLDGYNFKWRVMKGVYGILPSRDIAANWNPGKILVHLVLCKTSQMAKLILLIAELYVIEVKDPLKSPMHSWFTFYWRTETPSNHFCFQLLWSKSQTCHSWTPWDVLHHGCPTLYAWPMSSLVSRGPIEPRMAHIAYSEKWTFFPFHCSFSPPGIDI